MLVGACGCLWGQDVIKASTPFSPLSPFNPYSGDFSFRGQGGAWDSGMMEGLVLSKYVTFVVDVEYYK
jgi:hypothetical protein